MEVPDHIPEAADLKKTLPTIVGGLVGILSFAFIVAGLLWFGWKDRTDPGLEKAGKLQEMRQAARKSLGEYRWVDRKNGVVHIPISRAMDLYLQEQGK